MDDGFAAMRWEKCELVGLGMPENSSPVLMNGEILSAWCGACARRARVYRYNNPEYWKYGGRRYTPGTMLTDSVEENRFPKMAA
jgi:hypothetical protein